MSGGDGRCRGSGPEASALLKALRDPSRGLEAVVISEPDRVRVVRSDCMPAERRAAMAYVEGRHIAIARSRLLGWRILCSEPGAPGERGDLNPGEPLVEPHASRLVIGCQKPLVTNRDGPGFVIDRRNLALTCHN